MKTSCMITVFFIMDQTKKIKKKRRRRRKQKQQRHMKVWKGRCNINRTAGWKEMFSFIELIPSLSSYLTFPCSCHLCPTPFLSQTHTCTHSHVAAHSLFISYQAGEQTHKNIIEGFLACAHRYQCVCVGIRSCLYVCVFVLRPPHQSPSPWLIRCLSDGGPSRCLLPCSGPLERGANHFSGQPGAAQHWPRTAWLHPG